MAAFAAVAVTVTGVVGAVFPEQDDEELRQLAQVYRPVLWAPERPVVEKRCWSLYSAERPGVKWCEGAAKEANSEKNSTVLRVRPQAVLPHRGVAGSGLCTVMERERECACVCVRERERGRERAR